LGAVEGTNAVTAGRKAKAETIFMVKVERVDESMGPIDGKIAAFMSW